MSANGQVVKAGKEETEEKEETFYSAKETASPLPPLTVSPEDDKWDIRKKVWTYIEQHGLANFPRPVTNRIPNVKGAATACDAITDLEVFKKAQSVKVNPDKPQEQARFKVLECDKTLLVPTPRLRQGLFNKITPPEERTKEVLRICATAQGVREYSKPLELDSDVKIDLVIDGSVAVSPQGWRIGKGEGYADLEFAMMACMGAVGPNTVIVTAVHDCQVLDMPEKLFGIHDITVDYICTPTRIIECKRRPKPTGIFWSMLTKDKLRKMPILRKLRDREREQGRDVTLKDEFEGDDDKVDEHEDEERAGRRNYDRGGRRPRRYRRYRFRRNTRSEGEENEGEDRQRTRSEEERDEGMEDGGDRAQQKRRRRNRQRYRRRVPRKDSQSEEGENDENRNPNYRGDDGEEGKGEMRPRRPRRYSRPRGGPGAPTVYVGSVPRSVRVSEFKSLVRDQDVNPLRVIWHGATGHAFLQFESRDEADEAVNALQSLRINDKDLKVELSNRTRGISRENREAADIDQKVKDEEN